MDFNGTIIGLTGMSGAGKTTACAVFRDNGFYVIDCDLCAREVTRPFSPCLKELQTAFGRAIIGEDGTLLRKKLGAIVFSDAEQLKRLDKIIFPFICYTVIEKILIANKGNYRYILLDAPTLFEGGIDTFCSSIVSVIADKDSCAKRIMKRDGLTYESAVKRLSSQKDAQFFEDNSQYVLYNSGEMETLQAATSQVINSIKEHNYD